MNGFDWTRKLSSLRAEHLPDPRLGVWEIEVVRPYASSEDGPTGFPTTGGTTGAGGTVGGTR